MTASPLTPHSSPAKPRLRLPAFAKALLLERRQGRHPMVVHLAYDEDWNKRGEGCDLDCGGGYTVEEIEKAPSSLRNLHPRLAVRPSEFEAFRFDWTVVTGCLVAVFDGRPELFGPDARKFYELLGELGRYAGPIVVYRLEPCDPPPPRSSEMLKSVAQEMGPWQWGFFSVPANTAFEWKKKNGDWPTWWPVETERINGPRRERWGRLNAGVTGQQAA